jgi:hypothetical protein
MNQGRSLTDLARELERQRFTRRDYVAETTALTVVTREETDARSGDVEISGLNGTPLPLTEYAHAQMSEYTEIPKVYYDRCRKADPALLATNLNHWLHNEPDKRMVRTLDGNVRAWLSPKYRPMDNYDLAETVIPELMERSCQIESAELTERRFYIKAVLGSLEMEVRHSKQPGDIVQAGVVISNSEIGSGALKIEPLVFRLVCRNGLIVPDAALRKYHVGRATQGDGVFEVLSDEATRADDKALWLRVRDVVRNSFDRDVFAAIVQKMSDAAEQRIESADLAKVVEVTTRRLDLPERVQGSVLMALAAGSDLSRWGLVNALTSVANTEKDYEVATELERAGGKVLELAPRDWRVIAEAA